jgi:septal ring factor EnvC (AmiA/AmiB activator)
MGATMNNLEWLDTCVRNRSAVSPQRSSVESVSVRQAADNAGSARDGEVVLDLINRAAETFQRMEQRANENEDYARDPIEKAVQKLKGAEKRIQQLEKQQLEAEARINEVRSQLQVAGEALDRERARVAEAELQLGALEVRARSAETRAEECEKTLARIEDAVRTEILGQRPPDASRLRAVA